MVYPNYYYRYNYYNRRPQNYNFQTNTGIRETKATEPEIVDKPIVENDKDTRTAEFQKRISSKRNSFANLNFSNLFSSNLEEPILEILGIKLFFDDILIIGLLFFLYNEGVKDEFLFITLILLLLG